MLRLTIYRQLVITVNCHHYHYYCYATPLPLVISCHIITLGAITAAGHHFTRIEK